MNNVLGISRSVVACVAALVATHCHMGTEERLPIIDMHLHAYHAEFIGKQPVNPVTGQPSMAATDEALRNESLARLSRYNIVRAVTGGPIDVRRTMEGRSPRTSHRFTWYFLSLDYCPTSPSSCLPINQAASRNGRTHLAVRGTYPQQFGDRKLPCSGGGTRYTRGRSYWQQWAVRHHLPHALLPEVSRISRRSIRYCLRKRWSVTPNCVSTSCTLVFLF